MKYYEHYAKYFPEIRDERRATVKCPFDGHSDHSPHASAYLETGVFICPKHGKFSAVRFAEKMGTSCPFPLPNEETAKGTPDATYEYFDADGTHLFTKEKFVHADGRKSFNVEYQTADKRQVLFNLPDVAKANCVVVFEGEKDALMGEHLQLVDVAAYTTAPNGATSNWQSFAPALAGKEVILVPDNDDAGKKYVENLSTYAHTFKSFRVVLLPDKDLTEWVEKSDGSAEKFQALLSQVRDTLLENNDIQSIVDVLPTALDEIHAAQKKDGPIGVRTLRTFDDWFWGFERGATYGIGGKTSMGKTALALTLAKAASDVGHRVLYLALESSKTLLVKRVVASVVGIPTTKLRRGLLSPDELERIKACATHLPFHLYFAKQLHISSIERAIRAAVARTQIDFVILDHLMEVQFPSGSNENEELKRGIRTLYDLADELKYAQILLAQFHKTAQQKKGDHDPELGDTRGSISFDQAVDVMMYITRDTYGMGDADEGATKIIVAKDRLEGHTGCFHLMYDKQYTRFVDCPIGWNPPVVLKEKE